MAFPYLELIAMLSWNTHVHIMQQLQKKLRLCDMAAVDFQTGADLFERACHSDQPSALFQRGDRAAAGQRKHAAGQPCEAEDLGKSADLISTQLAKQPFGVKTEENRGLGTPTPLERPYEYLDADENVQPWDVSQLFS